MGVISADTFDIEVLTYTINQNLPNLTDLLIRMECVNYLLATNATFRLAVGIIS